MWRHVNTVSWWVKSERWITATTAVMIVGVNYASYGKNDLQYSLRWKPLIQTDALLLWSLLKIYLRRVLRQVFLQDFTQCPLRVALQPACSVLCSCCLEPVTSVHRPPCSTFLQSHTSALTLQGAVTFQRSPLLPSLLWHSAIDTDTLGCILSRASGKK